MQSFQNLTPFNKIDKVFETIHLFFVIFNIFILIQTMNSRNSSATPEKFHSDCYASKTKEEKKCLKKSSH